MLGVLGGMGVGCRSRGVEARRQVRIIWERFQCQSSLHAALTHQTWDAYKEHAGKIVRRKHAEGHGQTNWIWGLRRERSFWTSGTGKMVV